MAGARADGMHAGHSWLVTVRRHFSAGVAPSTVRRH
jgi:hypothetical protein